MLKLHGFSVSNYYNMVKLALLTKDIPFEEVLVHGSQEPAFLAISPRGKVPVLETEQGFINETGAILEYLEERFPQRPLLPADPYQRGVVRALVREIELYIELPARSCYPQAFFGMPLPEAIREKGKAELLAGVAALARHGRFAPYVAGDALTIADLYFLYSIDLAGEVAQKLFDTDLLAELPGARALLAKLGAEPHVQRIAADKAREMPSFLEAVKARARG
ncbi:glutathione S-transferase [Pseudomonas sp. zfem005]|uniref:glutathione S-transferase family protein n=1 Tax=Pseudomonas sp. zfem005 TaxID=3078200 RepID=UPI002928CED7|nr:glutathione S-transferase [Pseudomonas sp. zfem005]MDU9411157.1 glutathione S-transferase [Pseudomonas sp. zfem005]